MYLRRSQSYLPKDTTMTYDDMIQSELLQLANEWAEEHPTEWIEELLETEEVLG